MGELGEIWKVFYKLQSEYIALHNLKTVFPTNDLIMFL